MKELTRQAVFRILYFLSISIFGIIAVASVTAYIRLLYNIIIWVWTAQN